ncbi:MAG: hypothetical protein KF746_22485 [Chitinophagaceae bacterium]|nr:hypothetical protein [Chitinophagaceae bacterium]
MTRSFSPKHFFTFYLTLAVSISALAGEIPWRVTEIMPGGRIDAIAYAGNNIVICGTRSPNPGWIFYSTDNGFTWQKGQQLPSTGKRVGVTCIATVKNGTVIAINESSELFKSKDYGKTWIRTGKVSHSTRNGYWALSYGICITKQGSILISDTDSTGGSVYRSTDEGATFQKVVVSHKGLYRFDLVRNGIIVNGWAGCIYKSEDDGQSWKLWSRMDTTTALYATEYIRPGTIVQASEKGNVYRCNDDGATGHSQHLGNPGNGAAADDFVYLGYHTLIYTTYTAHKKVFISYDEGKTWKDDGPVPTGAEGDWLDHVIAMDQKDSVIAIGGTNKGFIVRAAFARADLLAKTSDPGKVNIPVSLKRDIDKGWLGDLYDPKELDEPEDILLDGNYAYVPCRGGNNLAVIDISNPRKPVLASSFRDPELVEAMGVSKYKNYIYISSFSNRKCLVVDAGDPKNLKKIYSFTVGAGGPGADQLRKVVYHEGYLYLTHDDESKLYIADARNPARPAIISSITTGNDGVFAVFIKGNYAYTGGCFPANGPVGRSVRVIDIADKRHPKLVSGLIDSARYSCICSFQTRDDQYLVNVGWMSNSVSVLDISNPAAPVERGYLRSDLIGWPNRVAIMGNKAYTINSVSNSLAQIDISSPEKPVIDYIVPSWKLKKGYGIAAKDGLVYMVGRDSRCFVIVDPSKYE